MSTVISSLAIFPVKSARGILQQTMTITAKGAAGDRLWAVVDAAQQNLFLSQRTHPALAQITVQLDENQGVILQHETAGQIHVPRPQENQTLITMYKEQSPVFDAGDAAAAWLQPLLGLRGAVPRLVFQGEAHFRPSDRPESLDNDAINLSDGFPFLLTNTASLNDLNGRASASTPMGQFRPNIVVDGLPPFDEDYFQHITIGDVVFEVVKACGRCKITTLDQNTGMFSPGNGEPLKTLSTYRRFDKSKVYFGVYMIPRSSGAISLGDELVVQARRPLPLNEKGMTW